jgi:hypothetical protein
VQSLSTLFIAPAAAENFLLREQRILMIAIAINALCG